MGYKKISSKTAFTFRTLQANACKDHQEFLLNGLQRATNYLVIVKAYNYVGTGPPSDQVTVHTTDGGEYYTVTNCNTLFKPSYRLNPRAITLRLQWDAISAFRKFTTVSEMPSLTCKFTAIKCYRILTGASDRLKAIKLARGQTQTQPPETGYTMIISKCR